MPNTINGEPVDEKKWSEAKRRAAEEGHEDDYAYIMGIYKQMAGMKSVIGYYYDLMKAKAAAQGEVRVWSDGKKRKKVGKKWVVVGHEDEAKAKAEIESKTYFDHAMASDLGDAVEDILQQNGVESFEQLAEKIKTGPRDTAHKLYKEIVDRIRGSSAGSKEAKQAALHLIGTALVKLKDFYASGPKAKAKVKVTSEAGKTYYKYPGSTFGVTEELPTLKPSAIAAAKKKMGGWSVTGELETKHVREMLKRGTAKLLSGKIDSKKKWHMPKKAEDMELKYSGDSLKVTVKQVKKVKERTRATAKVEISIPYAFAKAFLINHIDGKKTRNNFIYRMENSKGYRQFMDKAAKQ